MKYSIIISCLCFFLANTSLQAQQIGLRGLSFLGLATNAEGGYFYNGGGVDLYYQHDLGKGRIEGGAEFRMINWGNQIAINLGYNLQYWAKKQWRVSGTMSAQIGWALFRQKTLAVWGLEYIPQIQWQSNQRFYACLGIGFRFSNCPAYSHYSRINSTFDLPIKVGFGFKVGKKKAKKKAPID